MKFNPKWHKTWNQSSPVFAFGENKMVLRANCMLEFEKLHKMERIRKNNQNRWQMLFGVRKSPQNESIWKSHLKFKTRDTGFTFKAHGLLFLKTKAKRNVVKLRHGIYNSNIIVEHILLKYQTSEPQILEQAMFLRCFCDVFSDVFAMFLAMFLRCFLKVEAMFLRCFCDVFWKVEAMFLRCFLKVEAMFLRCFCDVFLE